MLFDGRDAAGKGGTIKRCTEHLNRGGRGDGVGEAERAGAHAVVLPTLFQSVVRRGETVLSNDASNFVPARPLLPPHDTFHWVGADLYSKPGPVASQSSDQRRLAGGTARISTRQASRYPA